MKSRRISKRWNCSSLNPNKHPPPFSSSQPSATKPVIPPPWAPVDSKSKTAKNITAQRTFKPSRFEIARRIVLNLVGGGVLQPDSESNPKLRLQSRHRLFPQVYRLVDAYVGTKVDFHGCNPCEIGHEKYTTRIVERLMAAIQPNEVEGKPRCCPS